MAGPERLSAPPLADSQSLHKKRDLKAIQSYSELLIEMDSLQLRSKPQRVFDQSVSAVEEEGHCTAPPKSILPWCLINKRPASSTPSLHCIDSETQQNEVTREVFDVPQQAACCFPFICVK